MNIKNLINIIQKSRIRKVAILGIIIAFVITQSSFVSADAGHSHGDEVQGGNSEFPTIDIVKVQKANDLNQVIEAAGEVLPKNESGIYALQSGLIQELYVDIGDEVKKGQVVGYLKAGTAQAALAAEVLVRQAELEAAKQNYKILNLTEGPQNQKLLSQKEILEEKLFMKDGVQKNEQAQLLNDMETIKSKVISAQEIYNAKIIQIDDQIIANDIAINANKLAISSGLFDLSDAITRLLFKTPSMSNSDRAQNMNLFNGPVNLPNEVRVMHENFYSKITSNKFDKDLFILLNDGLLLAENARILSTYLLPTIEVGGVEGAFELRGEIDAATDHLLDLSEKNISFERDIKLLESERKILLTNYQQKVINFELELKRLDTEVLKLGSQQGIDLGDIQADLVQVSNDLDILEGSFKQQRSNANQQIAIKRSYVQATQSQIGTARSIVAPFSGVITKRYLNIGEAVAEGTPIYDVVDDSNKFIRFFITETDLHFVKKGQDITFSPTAAPSLTYKASISRLSKSIDEETRTILVEADINENDNLEVLSHMTVRVHITIDVDETFVVIPTKALELSKSKEFIWIVNSDIQAVKKEITLEFVHQEYAYIRQGLLDSDWVVVNSQATLKDGLDVQTNYKNISI